jgi:murein DD-endopeptidase MepM/ murein hydrolase activator NlpD
MIEMRGSAHLIVAFVLALTAACATTTPQRTLVVAHVEEAPDDRETTTTRVVSREGVGGTELNGTSVERSVTRVDLGTEPVAEVADGTADEMPRSDECFALPVENPEITSPFGMRDDPIRRGRIRMHRGVDLRGATGTPVYATASGVALMAGYCDRGTGNCVVIEHPHGWRSQYFHLNAVHIRAGETVEQGEHIGDIGSTGRSTGPHLHFQLGRDGEAVDPMTLIGAPLDQ